MVGPSKTSAWSRASVQTAVVTLAALLVLGWQTVRSPAAIDVWLTKDQQGQRAFAAKDWQAAADRFADWNRAGTAAYHGGLYELAAQRFAGGATAVSYFNRGDALMKAGKYRDAVRAFELAVDEAPEWREAQENLKLARYVVDYIERSREQSDTGDESELSADDFSFDNEENRGKDVEVTRDSAIAAESAEKWMRAVDTDTADFLKTRFRIEATLEESR